MTIVVACITASSSESPRVSFTTRTRHQSKALAWPSNPPLDDACGQETSAMVRISVLNDTLSTSIIVRTRFMTRRDVARVATAPNRVPARWRFRVCD